jgi:hypothetical protein
VASLSVPREDPLYIRLRRAREANDHFFRLRESRTCDQGRVA